ncbi:MAG: alpha/beta hydrolase, partial [Anaerolineae bacterium]|nr:alpha/beta hydrolase [Anaerolineae bacterium]
MSIKNFIHRYEAATTANSPTLLLLHGTGGDENSLIQIGSQLVPDAAILSLRGKVLENGMPRFFRRLAEGVFDQEDLLVRTHELADFIQSSSAEYEFDLSSVIAVGYSNGANIAASLMLLHPGLIQRAVLFRAMLPFTPTEPLDLTGTNTLLLAGRYDNLIPTASVEALASALESAGANVDLNWQPTDHRLTPADLSAAHQW